ncbi:hypothetical protein P0L94_08220 [Microbacter sp. GSS18]|nr:hypothetical protein P0L94_08220 [Microbacter sp. GSS18]
MAEPISDNLRAGSRVRRRHARVGWILLLTGAFTAVGIVALSIVANRLVCQNPPYAWGANRTAVCAGDTGGMLLTVGQVSVTILVVAAVVGGVVFGVLESRSTGFRASVWLLLSTSIYGSMVLWDVARASSILDLGIVQSMAFASLSSAAVLAVWLVLSGVAVALSRVLRRPARS